MKNLFRTIGAIRFIAGLLLVGVMGFAVMKARTPPAITYIKGDDNTITKIVEVPTITEKTVMKYIPVEDRKAVEALIAANKFLDTKIEQLTRALALSQSTGSGPVTVTVGESTGLSPAPTLTTFKDWRLNFQSNGSTANYTLTQKFSILNSVGRNRQNVPVAVTRLFEVGPNGERVPIPITETISVALQQDQSHWYMSPSLQLGMAAVIDGEATQQGYVVAVQWWKRGKIEAAESTRWAILTPVVLFPDTTVGLLPVSLNLGTVLRSPLRDVWVSPFIGQNLKTSSRRLGVAFTATF